MKEKFLKGYSFTLFLFVIFITSSVIGWVYEVLTIMIENQHGFQNRGVLFGPYLPIYGFGVLLLVATVNPIRKIPMSGLKDKSRLLEFLVKLVLVFIATVAVTTLVELLATYLISPGKWVEGEALWFYSPNEGYDINFQGRIALKSSLRFGLGGSLLLYTVYPLLNRVCKRDNKKFIVIATILLLVFLAKLVFTYVF